MDNYYEMLKTSPEAANGYLVANNDIIAGCEEAKKAYETAKDALKDSEEAYVGYNATIQNYEGLSSAIISGDSEKISQAMQNMQSNFITAETGTKESLERQVQNMRDNFTNLQQAVIDGTPGVTNQMVTSAQQMWTASVQELNKFQAAAGESTAAAGDAAVASFAQKNPDFLQAGIDAGLNADSGLASTQALLMQTAKNIAESSDSELGSADTKATGDRKGQEYNTGLSSTKESIDSTSESIAKSSNEKLGSKNTKGTGDRKGQEYNTGLAGQKGNIDSTSQSIATSSDTILGSKDTSGTGQRKGTEYKSGLQSTQDSINTAANSLSNLANVGLAAANTSATGSQKGQQYVSGVNSQAGSANSAGRNLANNADSGARSTSGHSAGSNFGSGFVSGISDWIESAASAAASLASRAYNAARNWLDEHSPSRKTRKVGKFFTQGMALGIEDDADMVEKASTGVAQTALEAMNLSAISSRLRDVMSLNTGRISQAITGQTLKPQYYYNTEERNVIDYDLMADKFASVVQEKLIGLGVYMNNKLIGKIITPTVNEELGKFDRRKT